MATRGARRLERGAAAVEFALVLVPLLTIVLGAVDWGYYFFQREIVVNAAREGARAGSIADAATVIDDAKTRTQQYLSSAGIEGCTIDVDTGPDGGSAAVTVSCSGGSVTGFLKGLLPASIWAHADMRRGS